jgi:hypothetical protein
MVASPVFSGRAGPWFAYRQGATNRRGRAEVMSCLHRRVRRHPVRSAHAVRVVRECADVLVASRGALASWNRPRLDDPRMAIGSDAARRAFPPLLSLPLPSGLRDDLRAAHHIADFMLSIARRMKLVQREKFGVRPIAASHVHVEGRLRASHAYRACIAES